jgi:hypothetical protein
MLLRLVDLHDVIDDIEIVIDCISSREDVLRGYSWGMSRLGPSSMTVEPTVASVLLNMVICEIRLIDWFLEEVVLLWLGLS